MRAGRDNILGIVLAGGRATRMGGGDKGLLSLGPCSMIEAVLARLAPQCAAVVLSANGDPDRFAGLGLPVLADTLPGLPGPLAGVLAGLEEARRKGLSHVLSVPADAPFLPHDLAERLVHGTPADAPIAMATNPDPETGRNRRQPVIALWPVALQDDLRAALQAGVSKVGLWADRHGVALVPFDDPAAFLNVNTPQDLEIARGICAAQKIAAGKI